MPSPSPYRPRLGQHVVIIEDDEDQGRWATRCVTQWGSVPHRLSRPDDEALRHALRTRPDAVAVVSRDDIVALRYALLVEHITPGVRLVVTIFDRTVADEVARTVPNCTVLSTTDAIVPSLLASCLDPRYAMLQPAGDTVLGVRAVDGPTGWERLSRRALTAGGAVRSRTDPLGWIRSLGSSAKILLATFVGLLGVLALDTVLGVVVLHEHWPEALWNATRTLTTTGTSPAAEHAPSWYKVLTTASMLTVLALAALFTASLVDRLTGHRMTSILGARSIPRHHHVIVVGLGQVGLRLSIQLRALGVRVVALERDPAAACLPLAKALNIPVVQGRGGDRFLLKRVGVTRARALAAVSSDGLENIAVAVAARAIAPEQQIVLRAGGDEVTAESQSLFRIGAVCDVPRIVGAFVAACLLSSRPSGVFVTDGRPYALCPDNTLLCLDDWDTTDIPRSDQAAPAQQR
ncbi:NAD-binding protein [Streptomyces sp. LHD-70]|uniref:NAD-binding protein n=1 Tax=Streptomyces sp. LHD-70 TaxID=3072140 RepID=UPI00280CBE7A|nr:NAD-binding protein [Streptomyces sp. LHD-70]MDQ8708114.1 NAD-binding protein [Streptomyces sp. LHD-70]